MGTCSPLGRKESEPKCSHGALSGQGSPFLGAPGSGQLLPGAQEVHWPLHTRDPCCLSFPQEMIPFAVVGSDHEYQVNGKRILGRKTKWGTIEGNCQAAGVSRPENSSLFRQPGAWAPRPQLGAPGASSAASPHSAAGRGPVACLGPVAVS